MRCNAMPPWSCTHESRSTRPAIPRAEQAWRKACGQLERRPLAADQAANLTKAIVIATFRRPAALVPWSTQELSKLEQLWQTAYKEVWHLMRGTCADILMFSSHAGCMQYPRPMAILWEATSRHKRAFRHNDVTRQIIIKELQSALKLWQDLVEEAAHKNWEGPPQHFLTDGQKWQRVQDEGAAIAGAGLRRSG